jgi:hypothetical protein
LVGGGVLLIGSIISIIIFRKKRKVRDEDDDIDYFLSQMNTGSGSPQAEKEEVTQ